MRITKALIAKLQSNLKATLTSLSKDDVAYIVKKANEAYHAGTDPFISDDIFDEVKRYLITLDPTAPAAMDVGAAPITGKKVTLPYYMGSMDKIKTDDKALEKFTAKFPGSYLVTDKLDGISALLRVKDNVVTMYSRGDGTTGQDISHLLSHISGVPSHSALVTIASRFGGELCARGELIITKADFETVKSRGANARNMVAGIVNAKKPDASIAKLVKFMAYTLIAPNTYTPSGAYEFLVSSGFNTAHNELITTMDFAILSNILVRRRNQSPFEVDGIVVSHNAIHALESGKNPTYAFAFKNIITQETAEVIVSNVEWNVSKDGYLVPVVEFEPVRLSGVMVKRASGFNGEFIHTNSIGPGARIIVTRSGDVIPYILQILVPASQPQMPEEQFLWTETRKDIYLENPNENAQMRLRQLENFFTKLDVPGMKAGTIGKLFNAGFDNLEKILSADVSDIAAIDGFQHKSAEKIVDAIKEKLAKLDCVDLMDASNAFGRGFGNKRLSTIVAAIPKITNDTYIPSKDELLAVEGVSVKTCEAFLKGLALYRKFKIDLGIKCTYKKSKTETGESSQSGQSSQSRALASQVVVFTGFRNAALAKQIEVAGGEVGDTITKKTTILVAKDADKSTSKIKKAQENGVKVYSVEQFKSAYAFA